MADEELKKENDELKKEIIELKLHLKHLILTEVDGKMAWLEGKSDFELVDNLVENYEK